MTNTDLPSGTRRPDCPLCAQPGGDVLWQDIFARVVLADEPDHPGFCRVILNAHCKEMTDLTARERERLMLIVFTVESLLRALLQPDKINLASLGNVVAHLHWHVIPRFTDDPQYPASVWSVRQRENTRTLPMNFATTLAQELATRLTTNPPPS